MWHSFFLSAGIPENVARRYAKNFSDNRMSMEMLAELDKGTLAELGVTAIGDQLAILRYIKEDKPVKKAKRVPISAPSSSDSSMNSAIEARKGRPPPDRNEIYHIRMPVGATHKTQRILRKTELLKSAGLLRHGESGVRQGGRPVSPVSKDAASRRLALHNRKMQIDEVSSTSDRDLSQLGIRGMYSDRRTGGGVLAGRVQKIPIVTPTARSSLNQRFSVLVDSGAKTLSRITAGKPGSALRVGSGNINARVVIPSALKRHQLQTAQPIRKRENVQVIYDDGDMDADDDNVEYVEEIVEDEDERFAVNAPRHRPQPASIFDRLRKIR